MSRFQRIITLCVSENLRKAEGGLCSWSLRGKMRQEVFPEGDHHHFPQYIALSMDSAIKSLEPPVWEA